MSASATEGGYKERRIKKGRRKKKPQRQNIMACPFGRP